MRETEQEWRERYVRERQRMLTWLVNPPICAGLVLTVLEAAYNEEAWLDAKTIVKRVEALTGGLYTMPIGMAYNVLNDLVWPYDPAECLDINQYRLIRKRSRCPSTGRIRYVYAITHKGISDLDDIREHWGKLVEVLASPLVFYRR